jgi:predicted amidohydrolase YtcJ
MRLDGHMALTNSLALKLAGVDRNTVDVEGGEIVRDADGVPTGLLKDNAMNLVTDVIPAPSPAQQDQALKQAMDYLAERGVTTVHDMGYDWDNLTVFRRAHANNELRTRIYANLPLSSWQQLVTNRWSQGFYGWITGFTHGRIF